MKKFLGALLSFIMVFTIILPAIGPAALASGNCPDNCEALNLLPGYELTSHFDHSIDGHNVHCVVCVNGSGTRRSLVYVDGTLSESKQMTSQEIQSHLPYDFDFNGTNGYVSDSMSDYIPGFIDPPRADYINYTNQPFPLDENKNWLAKANDIEQGYRRLGSIECENLGENRSLYFDVYRHMSRTSERDKFYGWDEGTTLGLILCVASVIDSPESILTWIGVFMTVGDIVKIATSDLMVDYVTFNYDYIIVDPDGVIHPYNTHITYRYFKTSNGEHQYEVTSSSIQDISFVVSNIGSSSFTTYGQHIERYDTPCIVYCWICGMPRTPPHMYANCEDSFCNLCDNNRGSVSGVLYADGHVYDDCLDTTCNRCLYERPARDHSLVGPLWEAVGEYDKCRVYMIHCTDCTYSDLLYTDNTHSYSDCADTTCDDCSYYRGTVSGLLYPDGHVYDNCYDLTCNRCLYERPAPAHMYVGPVWESAGEYDKCQVYTIYCQGCSYNEILQTDTSHSYTDCADTTCDVCSYYRGPVNGYLASDGHVYADCLDKTCERGDYTRATAAHTMSEPSWEAVGVYNICQVYTKYCTRPGCIYSEILEADNTHTYTDCADTTCNVCYYNRGTVSGYLDTDGHVYDDCYDLTCNRCLHTRTAPNHIMTSPAWVNVGEYDKCQVYTSYCTRPGCTYSEILNTDASHTYSDCTDTTCNVCNYYRGAASGYLETDGHYYDNCYDLTCNRCLHTRTAPVHIMSAPAWVNAGTYDKCQVYTSYCTRSGCTYAEIFNTDTSHTYTDCTDTTCNVCSYNRGSVSGYLDTDGHVYTDCYDLVCNRCLHNRTSPGHIMSSPSWVNAGTYDKCQVYTSYCTRSGCTYSEILNTDTSHTYTDCTDNTCNVCSYNRGSVSGYLDTDGHVYTDCYDLTCNRCLHNRTSPGHIMTGHRWVNVGEYNKCREYQNYCTRSGCSYYTVEEVDSTHSYSDCADTTCNVCSYYRGSVSGYTDSDGHVYTDCYDLSCNRCSQARTSTGHIMSGYRWVDVGEYNKCQEYQNYCTRSGCSYYTVQSTDSSHSYSDCADTTCNECNYNRGSVSGFTESDGHVYSSCTDLSCNRCGHSESSAHHLLNGYRWETIGTYDKCQAYINYCTRSGCSYSTVSSYDTSHSYSDCTDTTCNTCGYNRGSVSGIRYSDGHVYSDCSDTVCNRCLHSRSAVSHSYSYSWVDVSTASTCEKYVVTCSVCGYSYVSSYDYTHAWSGCTDTVCNDCGYGRTAPGHSYTYSWVDVRTAGTCEKFVGTCSVCGYSYISSYDYTHAWSGCTDTVCNDCGYGRTAPGHSYTYKWVDVCTASTCEKYVGTCSVCGYSYVSSYDYTHAYTNSADRICNDCGYVR